MSTPLHVAVDVGPLRGHRTGVGAAVAELLAALLRRRGGAAGAGDREIVLQPYLLSARSRPAAGERKLPIPAALAHRAWARSDRPRLDRWFGDVDVVHGTNYVVPPSRLPRLVSVYDCWFLRHPELASPTVARAGAVLRRAVAGGAHVHTSSEASADEVRELLGTDRVTAIHLGPLPVDPPPAEAPIRGLPTGRFVAAIGTRERRKNLPRLIEAFGGLAGASGGDADVDLDLDFVVAGAPGDDDRAIDAALERLPAPARRRVWVLGAVDAATKSWLVHHATAIAYPSLDEGFGFPVLEAQLAGVPILGATAGSIPEVGGEGVEPVDPLDVASIATGLLRIVDDEARRRELVAAGRCNVERFSWATTADRLAELYAQLAGEAQR